LYLFQRAADSSEDRVTGMTASDLACQEDARPARRTGVNVDRRSSEDLPKNVAWPPLFCPEAFQDGNAHCRSVHLVAACTWAFMGAGPWSGSAPHVSTIRPMSYPSATRFVVSRVHRNSVRRLLSSPRSSPGRCHPDRSGPGNRSIVESVAPASAAASAAFLQLITHDTL